MFKDRVFPTRQPLMDRLVGARFKVRSKALGKQAMYAQLGHPEADAYTYAIEVMAATSQLPDAREGMHAFLEKRKPRWRRGRD